MQRPGPRNRILNRDPRNPKVSTEVSSWLNFNPLSLKPEFWFDASDTTTIIESGGAVSQWNDKSGNGRNVSQATASLQPVTGVNTLNGLNVIKFDDDILAGVSFTQAQPITIAVVARTIDTTSTTRQIIGNDNTTPVIFQFASTWSYFAGTAFTTSTSITADWQSFVGTFNGASSNFRRNKIVISTANPGTNGYSSKRLLLGGTPTALTNLLRGDIAEVIVFYSVLTSNTLNTLENYLSTKWGLGF